MVGGDAGSQLQCQGLGCGQSRGTGPGCPGWAQRTSFACPLCLVKAGSRCAWGPGARQGLALALLVNVLGQGHLTPGPQGYLTPPPSLQASVVPLLLTHFLTMQAPELPDPWPLASTVTPA